MITIATFKNTAGSVELSVIWSERSNPAVVVDFIPRGSFSDRVYDGDSLETAAHTLSVYTRALRNRVENAETS
jgi:hypothetical protein